MSTENVFTHYIHYTHDNVYINVHVYTECIICIFGLKKNQHVQRTSEPASPRPLCVQ